MTEQGGDTVALTVPCRGEYVSTVRLTAAALAARCDLTVDDIEDLRLGVDEACTLLIPHAGDDAQPLHANFDVRPGRLGVTMSVPAADGAAIDRTGYGWTVLDALVGPITTSADAGRLSIALAKSRPA